MGREFCRAMLASTDSFRQKALGDLIHDKNTWSAIVGPKSTLISGQAVGTCFAKHRNWTAQHHPWRDGQNQEQRICFSESHYFFWCFPVSFVFNSTLHFNLNHPVCVKHKVRKSRSDTEHEQEAWRQFYVVTQLLRLSQAWISHPSA